MQGIRNVKRKDLSDWKADTLPAGKLFDRNVPFMGYWAPNRARVRAWGLLGEPNPTVVIVLTDSGEGTSITNSAEAAYCAAWFALGRPWPARFFEHYRGASPGAPRDRLVGGSEHMCEVRFAGTSGDGPIADAMMVHPAVGNRLVIFREPAWRAIRIADFLQLIGASDE